MRTPDADGSDPSGGPSRLLRAYAVTGGRTRPRHTDLEVESLVAATALGEREGPRLSMERRAIAHVCRQVLSIAEVAAHLDLPLGVARVLIGDMAAGGLVSIHRPSGLQGQSDLSLLQRVLAGLREI
jgi:hypothetical protein